MKIAKVLISQYSDKSGSKIVRVYLNKDFEQAQRDLNLLQEHASSDKEWQIQDVEIY